MKTLKKGLKRLLFVFLLLMVAVNLTGCLGFLAALLPIIQQVGQIVSTIGGLIGGQGGQITQTVGKVMTGIAGAGQKMIGGGGGNPAGAGAGNGQNDGL